MFLNRRPLFKPLGLPFRLRLADDAAAGDRGAGRVDLDDEAARAAPRAHRATHPVGQGDGRIGDAATAGLDDADRLSRQGGDGASALDAVGQQLLGEFGMNMNCDLRHDGLLDDKQLRAGAMRRAEHFEELCEDHVMENSVARLWSLSNNNRRAAVLPASDY